MAQPCVQTAESASKGGGCGFPPLLRDLVSAGKTGDMTVNAILYLPPGPCLQCRSACRYPGTGDRNTSPHPPRCASFCFPSCFCVNSFTQWTLRERRFCLPGNTGLLCEENLPLPAGHPYRLRFWVVPTPVIRLLPGEACGEFPACLSWRRWQAAASGDRSRI